MADQPVGFTMSDVLVRLMAKGDVVLPYRSEMDRAVWPSALRCNPRLTVRCVGPHMVVIGPAAAGQFDELWREPA